MKPQNNFINEAYMAPEGEPLEYFKPKNNGLEVKEATLEEWEEANAAFRAATKE